MPVTIERLQRGQPIRLLKPYFGFTHGIIWDAVSNNYYGCKLYKLTGELYQNAGGDTITVDFNLSEFTVMPWE